MNDQPVNLRPYGEIPPARQVGPLVVYDDLALANQRAQWKLIQWRQGNNQDEPAGRALLWPIALMAIALGELAGSLALGLMYGVSSILILSAPIAAVLFGHGALAVSRSGARSPTDCMREFVHCINRADFRRAYRLLAAVDKDSYLRAAPSAARHDPLSVKRYSFDSVASFAAYWRAARVLGPSSRLVLKASSDVQMLGDGIARVTLRVHVYRSVRMEREDHGYPVTRLLLRHGDEWRIFDGEVLNLAELNLNWVPAILSSNEGQVSQAPLTS